MSNNNFEHVRSRAHPFRAAAGAQRNAKATGFTAARAIQAASAPPGQPGGLEFKTKLRFDMQRQPTAAPVFLPQLGRVMTQAPGCS